MLWLKKLIFKGMELGLGVRPCFALDTKNPIFINFKLDEAEAREVQRALSPGFSLRKVRFFESDAAPEYWVSYNLYELRYPKKELASVRKVRCEINTFVQDAHGRRGIYVFSGSPYVSKETRPNVMGWICDWAERLVMFIYGCGKLVRMEYRLDERELAVELSEGTNTLLLRADARNVTGVEERLSDDYVLYNDVSFFNSGRTYDLVNVDSVFTRAGFHTLTPEAGFPAFHGPFFNRAPDRVSFHRGEISYVVRSLHRTAQATPALLTETSPA